MEILFVYLVVINVIGFVAMAVDKSRAKKNAWRISEKMLFGIILFGGSLGVWLGMNSFRHKTKHWYFKYGVPVIFLAQLIGMVYFLSLKMPYFS